MKHISILLLILTGCTVLENEQERHFRKAVVHALEDDLAARAEIGVIIDGRIREPTNSTYIGTEAREEVEGVVRDVVWDLVKKNWYWLALIVLGGRLGHLHLKNGIPKKRGGE